MGHADGAHTHGGGGFDPMPILIIIGAIVVAGPVAAAVAELLHLLVIVLAVLAGVVGAGVVAYVAFRVSHRGQEAARVLYSVTPAPTKPPPLRAEARPAIGQQAPAIEQHVHHHWHGVSAEEVADILSRRDRP